MIVSFLGEEKGEKTGRVYPSLGGKEEKGGGRKLLWGRGEGERKGGEASPKCRGVRRKRKRVGFSTQGKKGKVGHEREGKLPKKKKETGIPEKEKEKEKENCLGKRRKRLLLLLAREEERGGERGSIFKGGKGEKKQNEKEKKSLPQSEVKKK